MNAPRTMYLRTIAAAEVLLVSPAVLFLAAVVVRELPPPAREPARIAGRIVQWYLDRGTPVSLWGLLLALPLAALLLGVLTLRRGGSDGPRPPAGGRWRGASLVIAAATLASAAVLVVVSLHVLAN